MIHAYLLIHYFFTKFNESRELCLLRIFVIPFQERRAHLVVFENTYSITVIRGKGEEREENWKHPQRGPARGQNSTTESEMLLASAP